MHLSQWLQSRRSGRLTSPRARRRLAAGLERTLRAADNPPRLTSAIPVQREAVLRARDEIEELISDLLGTDDVTPRGVQLIHELLTDGRSPLFAPNLNGELHEAVRHAHAALHLN
jgi:hypothetical protein